MLADDAARLIQRLVDATDATDADDNNWNSDTATAIVIQEMRVFLDGPWECGKECGFSGSYGACAVHEDACLFDECSVVEVSIGGSEMLKVQDDEIDLSAMSYAIGDTGCTALCNSLRLNNDKSPTNLCMLDLEANGLSSVGGSELAAALHAVPKLTHLNMACNGIGGVGVTKLAAKLHHCPLLRSLDLHGNAIGNDGCVALGAALALADVLPALRLLDLGANRIEDRGCAALAPLFGYYCCPSLASLNLRENGIESSASLFAGVHGATKTLPMLTMLDLSWNCIANFDALWKALANNILCPALVELELRGNSLSDAGCARLCAELVASGATPALLIGGAAGGAAGQDGCEIPVAVVGEGRMRSCLRLLADGDATNSRVCHLPLWESTDDAVERTEVNETEELGSSADMRLPFDLLRRDGFVVQPPLVADEDMASLAATMDRLESRGWPPVFCFMNDAVWDFVAEQVWPAVRTLLGVDCVLDSGSAFAWSLKANGKSTFPRDGEFRSWQNAVSSINTTVPKEKEDKGHRGLGSSFGLPHRDYSAADSLHYESKEEGGTSDHPNILNVWIPLNDATLQNGCMHVVPREFDSDFARTDNHHAHMNPATEVKRGLSSKIHFPLHGVRALPAEAGSMIAWYGNTIHWGATCSRYAKVPRKSIALTFRRADKVGDLAPDDEWHALADDAVPPLIYETVAVSEQRRGPA